MLSYLYLIGRDCHRSRWRGGSAARTRRPGRPRYTATSTGSHHRELGRQLVRGPAEPLAGEGVHTLRMVQRHGLFDWRRCPLLDLIGQLLAEPATARVRMQDLLDHMRR